MRRSERARRSHQHEQVVQFDAGGETREARAVQRAAALCVTEHDLHGVRRGEGWRWGADGKS